jgi:hypothetical protein
MSRKHVLFNKAVIDEVGLDADFIGTETVCEQLDLVSYVLIQSNGSSLAGTFIIQIKDDLTPWIDLNTSTYSLSGATDTIKIDVDNILFKYIRPKITISAGSADFLVVVKGKTYSA